MEEEAISPCKGQSENRSDNAKRQIGVIREEGVGVHVFMIDVKIKLRKNE